MPGQYALILDGKVISCIVWDGPDASPMEFNDGVTYAVIDEGTDIQPAPGWNYVSGKFLPPIPSKEEQNENDIRKKESNVSLQLSLINDATIKISPYQTKLLIGRKLNDKESSLLNAWLDYIDELNAIDPKTVDDINWPEMPS
jgi:hypothetical protein